MDWHLRKWKGKQWLAECNLEVVAFGHRALVCWVTNKLRPSSPGREALDDINQAFFLLILLVIAIYLFQALVEMEECAWMQMPDPSTHPMCKCYTEDLPYLAI